MRKREHEFSVVVVQTVRSTYKRGFLSTLKGKNKEQQRALKQQRDMYEGKLETIRGASSAAERSAQADTSRAHAEASAFRDKVRTTTQQSCPSISNYSFSFTERMHMHHSQSQAFRDPTLGTEHRM